MPDHLKQLIDAAKLYKISAGEKEAQRQSFAYGNTRIENSRITREVVAVQAEKIKNASTPSR